MLGALLAAATLAATPTPAPQTPPTPAVAAAPKDPDPLICHTEPGLGTRLTHKVCMRASEAAERRLEARQSLARMQGANAPMPMMGPMH